MVFDLKFVFDEFFSLVKEVLRVRINIVIYRVNWLFIREVNLRRIFREKMT